MGTLSAPRSPPARQGTARRQRLTRVRHRRCLPEPRRRSTPARFRRRSEVAGTAPTEFLSSRRAPALLRAGLITSLIGLATTVNQIDPVRRKSWKSAITPAPRPATAQTVPSAAASRRLAGHRDGQHSRHEADGDSSRFEVRGLALVQVQRPPAPTPYLSYSVFQPDLPVHAGLASQRILRFSTGVRASNSLGRLFFGTYFLRPRHAKKGTREPPRFFTLFLRLADVLDLPPASDSQQPPGAVLLLLLVRICPTSL